MSLGRPSPESSVLRGLARYEVGGEEVDWRGDGVGLTPVNKVLKSNSDGLLSSNSSLLSLSELELELEVSLDTEGLGTGGLSASSNGWGSRLGEGICLAWSLYWKGLREPPMYKGL